MKIRLLVLVGIISSASGLAAENRTLFVTHSHGTEPILYAEVDSIRFSPIGLDSVQYLTPVVQEIWTPDTVYRYDISELISVSFEAPKTKVNAKAINLAGEISQYIEDGGIDEWGEPFVQLSSSIPENLVPTSGQYIYQLESSAKLPYGFAGRVTWGYDNILYCQEVELCEIFDTLVLNAESEYSPVEPVSRASGDLETGWLAAEITYPHGETTVITMTDELRDIPVGPEEAHIKSKIRVRPRVSIAAGIYVLGGERGSDGTWITQPVETHRIISRMHSRVEAHVEGRASVDAEHNLSSLKPLSIKTPFGLGRYINLTFSGNLKLKGLMGIDYDYSAEYNAAAVSTVMTSEDKQCAAMGSTFYHQVVEAPLHLLDASMEGFLTLSSIITASLTNITDSLKNITTTYVYGTKLDGKALYKTSQLEEGETNDALYRRITDKGVKASPLEMATASGRYGSVSLKNKSDIKPSASTIFYAVPLFKDPTYNNGELTYTVEGEAMKGSQSKLGFAVLNNDAITKRVSTSAVWPGAKKLTCEIMPDSKAGDIVYPTATLCNETILGAPSYPDTNVTLAPVVSSQSGHGVRIICGSTAIGAASKNNTRIYLGNIITIPKSKDK